MRRPLHKGSSAQGASNPNVSNELDAVVLKAVAPNPDLRYQSMVSLAGDLRGFIDRMDLDELRRSNARRRRRPPVCRILLMTLTIRSGRRMLWWGYALVRMSRAPRRRPNAPSPDRFRAARAASMVAVSTWET